MNRRPAPLARHSACFSLLVGLALCVVSCEPENAADDARPAADLRPAEPPVEPPPVGAEAELLAVVDGDTIRVRYGGRDERVRYIGIDTPEVAHESWETSERFGDEATEANERLLGDGTLRLVFDVERRDRYGRLLAYVYVDDTMINEALLLGGFAQLLTIAPNVRFAERFRAAQQVARDAGRGLWAP